MKQRKKFNSGEQQETSAHQHTEQSAAREFASVEDMLRADAAQTLVPESVAKRLQESTRNLPAPNRSWWQRFFGGNR